ncbi:hypothetical protein GEMRC1_003139 [Eukaryota sp. GEM-RC1]
MIFNRLEVLPSIQWIPSEEPLDINSPKFQLISLLSFFGESLKYLFLNDIQNLKNPIIEIIGTFLRTAFADQRTRSIFSQLLINYLEDGRVSKNYNKIAVVIACMKNLIQLTFDVFFNVLLKHSYFIENADFMEYLSYLDHKEAQSRIENVELRPIGKLLIACVCAFHDLLQDFAVTRSNKSSASQSFMMLLIKLFGDYDPVKFPLRILSDIVELFNLLLICLDLGKFDPFEPSSEQDAVKPGILFHKELPEMLRTNLNFLFNPVLVALSNTLFSEDLLILLGRERQFRNFAYIFHHLPNISGKFCRNIINIFEYFVETDLYPLFYNSNFTIQLSRIIAKEKSIDESQIQQFRLLKISKKFVQKFITDIKKYPSLFVHSLFSVPWDIAQSTVEQNFENFDSYSPTSRSSTVTSHRSSENQNSNQSFGADPNDESSDNDSELDSFTEQYKQKALQQKQMQQAERKIARRRKAELKKSLESQDLENTNQVDNDEDDVSQKLEHSQSTDQSKNQSESEAISGDEDSFEPVQVKSPPRTRTISSSVLTKRRVLILDDDD